MTNNAVAAHPYASPLTKLDPAGHHGPESASHTPQADDPGKKGETLPTLRAIGQASSSCRRLVGSRVMDQTNLHRNARRNAQEAITLARQRAPQFDTQAALDSKMNEALKLAEAQAHIGDDDESGLSGTSNTPLADRKFFLDAQVEVISGGTHIVDSDELKFQGRQRHRGAREVKSACACGGESRPHRLRKVMLTHAPTALVKLCL
ncbi:hypothetical protein EDD22DRAFT_957656 [Suillus occidentalis]|nr:hypothetical protein EDD22DRAFT_957656 [Suillus occidentalis]